MIGRTFAAGPVFTAQFPDPDERLRHCIEIYTGDVIRCLRDGSVWVAEGENGAVLGAITLVEMPARSAPAGTDPAAATGSPTAAWTDMMATFDADEAAGLEALAATQSGPWRYISVLAVDPAHQGEGIGTSLMRHTIAGADHDGLALGIMTEVLRTVRYYERLGFHIIRDGNEHDPVRYWVLLRLTTTTPPSPS